MSSITELLGVFEECLKKYCKPMYDRLLEPLEKSSVIRELTKLNVDDEDFNAIYFWRNGITNDGSLFTRAYGFCEFGVFPSLSELSVFYNLAMDTKDWNNSLVPLVVSYAGDFLLFQSDKQNESYGMLYLYSPNLMYVYDLVTYYDSISTMINTIIESFEAEVFKYDENDMILKVDYKKATKIATKNNPKSEYWDEYR